MEWVGLLAEEVGPRRPTGPAERRAAELVAERLTKRGISVEQRPFSAYSTFALPYGAALAVALLGLPAGRARPVVAFALAAAGAALTSAEDGLVTRPLTRAMGRSPSRNLVVTIEPREEAERTICLVCHLDSSRSGLLFHRRFLPLLHGWIATQAIAFGPTVAGPLLRRLPGGRKLLAAAYGVLVAGLGLLVERELRGADVPGANDNASGVAAVATLARELHAQPLSRTRVLCLFTGCEEAGVLGADAFVRELESSEGTADGSRSDDWRSWLFVNFDGVAAPATLRFLCREGVLAKWPADAHLARIAQGISERRPELGLEGTTITLASPTTRRRSWRAVGVRSPSARRTRRFPTTTRPPTRSRTWIPRRASARSTSAERCSPRSIAATPTKPRCGPARRRGRAGDAVRLRRERRGAARSRLRSQARSRTHRASRSRSPSRPRRAAALLCL